MISYPYAYPYEIMKLYEWLYISKNGMKKHCFSLFFVMKKNEKQCFINLITRRSSVQIWLPQPNLNGTIDTKVVPFFYTHKIPKIRTFCYEKKHLKNGFPFLWRAENKQRNEWVRATKRMSKGCIFLDLPFLWSKKRFFTEKSLPIGIYPTADFQIYMH